MTDNQSTNTTPEVKADNLTEELTGKERRLANLKPPINKRGIEEQKAICSKGGIARGEQRRQQRTMKEQMLALLNTKASHEQATKYLGDDAEKLTDDDLTFQGLLTAKMWQEATEKGNAKAAEFCRDTSGQAPKMQIDATVETFSESDRALMDKIAARLGILTDENDG